MNSTWNELAQGYAGIAAFALFFLAPGYVWASSTNLASFKHRSGEEQLLWSVCLSMPLGIFLCAIAGRVLPPAAINTLFALIDLAALLLWVSNRARRKSLPPSRSWTRGMLALMALFGLYCILAVTDFQIGHHLYVSTVIADWSVRVSMVKAAMRSGVPPINGLSTLALTTTGTLNLGHAPALRYYYFWYVVVAQMARTFHLTAHAALAASCAWAGWGLLAAFFLALKYMVGLRERRLYPFALLVGGILGLDILPTALLWLSPKLHPYPEMEYWRQDRTPSFLGAVLYAPHHIAAIASLLAGFLVLLLSTRSLAAPQPRRQTVAAAIFAGMAFAAAAGASLFPTFCFVFILGLWAVDLLRRREWRTLAALAGSGVLAVLLAHGYLQELSGGSSAASGFANLRWRNDDFLAMQQARHHLLTSHGAVVAFLARQPLVLVMDFFELGLYLLVLAHVLRRELLAPGRLAAGRCAVGALVLGAAIPCFFLSSTATSGPNDLGVDAGFLFRLGLQLWTVPWLWQLWQTRREPRPVAARPARFDQAWFALAMLLVALGLSAQLYQVVSERLYYAVVGTGLVHKQMDAFTLDRMPERMFNLRAAFAELEGKIPPSRPDTNVLQFNPIGAMQPAATIYNNHQVAAWDTGCGTSYGGDYKACAPLYAGLLFLYGNTQAGFDAGRAENDRQDGAAARIANAQDFAAACSTLHLRALVAESTDSIWKQPTSWVWTEPVLTANETVRILSCPSIQ